MTLTENYLKTTKYITKLHGNLGFIIMGFCYFKQYLFCYSGSKTRSLSADIITHLATIDFLFNLPKWD